VDLLESLVAAVVGVGDVGGCSCGVEGSDEVEFLLWGGCFDEVVFVLGVHGDDVVEVFDVCFWVELPGALG